VAVTQALLIAVTLLLQRMLGAPGGPLWSGLVVLPAAWIAGPALRSAGPRWVWVAVVIGLGWDLLMEPIVGPGAIAWSAAALATIRLAGIVADRSPKAWFAFGGLAAAVMLIVQRLALLPLGIDAGWRLTDLGLSVVATGAWCGAVGWIISLDVPTRWRAWRARKLR
jgi:hypothetical protein